MNERRTLHPSFILFGVLSVIRGFLPIILIMLFKGIEWSEVEWYWFAGIGVAFLFIVLLCFLQWKRFGFWMEADRLIIRQGVLFREEKTIYYNRIHSVNVEQPFIQRILGVAQLKIETPGGNKKADGILHTLSMKDANQIREQLRNFAQGIEKSAGSEQDTVGSVVLNAVDEQQSMTLNHVHNVEGSSSQKESNATQLKKESEPLLTLDAGKLFQAAATSLNFGLAIAFIGGLYSFADDFLKLFLPDHFFEDVVEDSTSMMSSSLLITIVAISVILLAWLLSVVLYILKYSGYAIRRDGKQISVSYGLLEKKTVLFDPKNVQAVITSESLLRQPFGYAEVKLQVVSSDKQEQLMLHPFVKVSEIQSVLDQFVPQMVQHNKTDLVLSPRKALAFYIRIPLLVAMLLCTGCIIYFGTVGAWSLLLLPLIVLWRISCHRTAGLLLKGDQLTLRKRFINRTTYYVRKPRIVTMKVKRSIAQRKRGIISLSVHVLGSALSYNLSYMNEKDVEPIWRWFSRRSAN
ncbi:PH domain-containing protein [Paenibacillus sp. GSMTC-2017]|uniref:PH domain-containing protein n=1 Tax=Paenibacillus sp. GSMTC-2017 TaxID=2794350 RepID=UPI0018D808B3|nr:PH domain-containing protein [Paenibacillus sp. GSMTC-2017]MBH5320158.1 PH domain-containing protein [Paenibacillus sp. GSMTC-2017]